MEKPHPPTLNIAIIPCPGIGHLIPAAELAKRLLLHHHNLHVTIIIPMLTLPSETFKSIFHSLPPSISSIFLPPPDLSDLPLLDLKIETIGSELVVRSLPSIREVFMSIVSSSSGGSRLAAVVTDIFGTDCIQLAKEFQAASYIFFTSNAMTLSLFLHLPRLDQMVSVECSELGVVDELVSIPGCLPIHGGDLLEPLQDRKNDAYKWVLHHAKGCRMADGIMVNSFLELERGPFKALQEPEPGKPMVFAVGPLVGSGTDPCPGAGIETLKWLDDQPHGSVICVSFGSHWTLSHEQMTELALGLEMSNHRFLWVVKSPSDNSGTDPFGFLPDGFMNRTKNRSLIVDSWAPQAHILSHGSTGGFLTHCGWNSILESVINGIPVITWPLHAEQKMNAFMLVEDTRVALKLEASGPNGIIERDAISKVVKNLMEGEGGKSLRSRMNFLKEAAAGVVGEDGQSTKALAQVVANWKKHIN